MSQRISGIDPSEGDTYAKSVFDAQARQWGSPLITNLVYARRPTIFRAVRGMWSGIDASGLLSPALRALINRRVASLNGCAF
jgi:alkylhydroperoxidase family enzyme